MSRQISIALFLAIFVAIVMTESPPSLTRVNDVTGDALTTQRTLSIIEMAKDRLVLDRNACKNKMTINRVRVQTNPGPLYMLYIRVEPCEGSTQATIDCKVDVLDLTSAPRPRVHTVECPPGLEN